MILRTEQEALAFMQNYHPSLRSFQNVDLQRIRQAVREAEPEIYHDVTRWRHRAIEQAMRDAGLSAQEAIAGANAAMMHFAKWRSQIEVPQATHETLQQLAKNGRWWRSLTAMPSRNCLASAITLSLYCAPARMDVPSPLATCISAAEKLHVPIGEILHVGDDLTTDVAGAIRCGMQACWIKPENADLMRTQDSRLLPHIEISRLASLTSLI